MTDDYEAVVYDLDGTLVRLAVDWAAARSDVAAAYEDAGLDPGDADVWELIDAADEHGVEDAAEAALSDHETDGARNARRLALADEVEELDVPVGVCSLNCEAACEIALERHDLAGAVDAVVGRDTVDGQKPDPEPLREAVERLGAAPERTLFVGDSASDEETAEAAGTDFQWVRERVDA